MKIIDKYLISEWLKWFSLCFLVLYSLLFLQFINAGYELFQSKQLIEIIRLFITSALEYLTWLFPISCFVATFLTFSFLTKNLELLVLDSTGVSTFSIAFPIVIVAILCCGVSWICQDKIKNITVSSKDLSGRGETKSKPLKMTLDSVHRTWFWGNYDLKTESGHKIHLYQYDESGNDVFRIRAQSGRRTENGWVFNDGVFLGFSSSQGIPIIKDSKLFWEDTDSETIENIFQSPKYKKKFDEIQLDQVQDNPEPFARLRESPKDLNFAQLNHLVNSYPTPSSAKLYPYRLRKAQLFWNVPACFFAVIFGMAFSLRRQQQSTSLTIGVCLSCILLFYILRTFCDALGKLGLLSEWAATGIPFGGMLLISIVILWRNK